MSYVAIIIIILLILSIGYIYLRDSLKEGLDKDYTSNLTKQECSGNCLYWLDSTTTGVGQCLKIFPRNEYQHVGGYCSDYGHIKPQGKNKPFSITQKNTPGFDKSMYLQDVKVATTPGWYREGFTGKGYTIDGSNIDLGSTFECPPGTYQDKSGATGCIPCPYGTYSDVSGASDISFCKACPTWFWTDNSGKTNKSDCNVDLQNYFCKENQDLQTIYNVNDLEKSSKIKNISYKVGTEDISSNAGIMNSKGFRYYGATVDGTFNIGPADSSSVFLATTQCGSGMNPADITYKCTPNKRALWRGDVNDINSTSVIDGGNIPWFTWDPSGDISLCQWTPCYASTDEIYGWKKLDANWSSCQDTTDISSALSNPGRLGYIGKVKLKPTWEWDPSSSSIPWKGNPIPDDTCDNKARTGINSIMTSSSVYDMKTIITDKFNNWDNKDNQFVGFDGDAGVSTNINSWPNYLYGWNSYISASTPSTDVSYGWDGSAVIYEVSYCPVACEGDWVKAEPFDGKCTNNNLIFTYKWNMPENSSNRVVFDPPCSVVKKAQGQKLLSRLKQTYPDAKLVFNGYSPDDEFQGFQKDGISMIEINVGYCSQDCIGAFYPIEKIETWGPCLKNSKAIKLTDGLQQSILPFVEIQGPKVNGKSCYDVAKEQFNQYKLNHPDYFDNKNATYTIEQEKFTDENSKDISYVYVLGKQECTYNGSNPCKGVWDTSWSEWSECSYGTMQRTKKWNITDIGDAKCYDVAVAPTTPNRPKGKISYDPGPRPGITGGRTWVTDISDCTAYMYRNDGSIMQYYDNNNNLLNCSDVMYNECSACPTAKACPDGNCINAYSKQGVFMGKCCKFAKPGNLYNSSITDNTPVGTQYCDECNLKFWSNYDLGNTNLQRPGDIGSTGGNIPGDCVNTSSANLIPGQLTDNQIVRMSTASDNLPPDYNSPLSSALQVMKNRIKSWMPTSSTTSIIDEIKKSEENVRISRETEKNIAEQKRKNYNSDSLEPSEIVDQYEDKLLKQRQTCPSVSGINKAFKKSFSSSQDSALMPMNFANIQEGFNQSTR